jgi:hypothetical protein
MREKERRGEGYLISSTCLDVLKIKMRRKGNDKT